MSSYFLNVKCEKCHHLFRRDGHGAHFYNSFTSNVCGKCGHHGFYGVSERWVSESSILNPFTWGRGRWEDNK